MEIIGDAFYYPQSVVYNKNKTRMNIEKNLCIKIYNVND